MKTTRMRNYSVLLVVIMIITTSSPFVLGQSQDVHHPQSIFHLQFALFISWDLNQTTTPFSPGETREINVTVQYIVAHGAYWWRLFFHFLDGKTFPIHLSIDNKSDWCDAWFTPENLSGVIQSDEVGITHSFLSIHVSDDAPTNFTLGWIKTRAIADNMKGPFNIITLIQSDEQPFTLTFLYGP